MKTSLKAFYTIVFLTVLAVYPGFGQTVGKQELNALADTLFTRGLIEKNNLDELKRQIEDSKITTEVFEFLPFIKNSRIIDLKSYSKQYKDPNTYLVAIYKDIAATIPGIKPEEVEVCNYYYGNFTCGEGKPLPGDEKVTGDVKGPGHHHWELKKKKDAEQKLPQPQLYPCGTCIDRETDVVKYVNDLLAEQKSAYRVAVVPRYSFEGQVKEDTTAFGVIALKKEQAAGWTNNQKPWLGSRGPVFPNYLTEAEIRKAIGIYREAGLLSHLKNEEIEKITSQVLKSSYTHLNDVIAQFPKVVYAFNWSESPWNMSYAKVTLGLSGISNDFKPVNVKDNSSSALPKGDDITWSFDLKGKAYTNKLSSRGFQDDLFLQTINQSLENSNAAGKFHFLLVTDELIRRKNTHAIIYLTDQQYKILASKGVMLFTFASGINDK